MDVPHWPHVAFLSTWLQLKNCTNLCTPAFWSTCMPPHWHLRQWHCTPAEGPFLKNFPTEPSAFIARSWWRWHTQQRILWRPDLVTNCLSLVSRVQVAVGTNLSLESLPSMADATDSKSLKIRSRVSVSDSSAFLPNFTSKIAACEFVSSSSFDSHRVEHILWSQFMHELTDNYLYLSGIPPSHNLPIVALHRAYLFSQNSRRNDRSVILYFSFFGNRLTQVLWFSEFTLPIERTHIIEKNTALVLWHVKMFNVCTCFFQQIAGKTSTVFKPCLCVNVVKGGAVYLVRVRIKF